ncbi:hypothetical protein IWQ56_000407 [Coemansia nantahalensis]|nr:hypothetical protein IWQ56_000407 [Coemansia nantahalensis]
MEGTVGVLQRKSRFYRWSRHAFLVDPQGFAQLSPDKQPCAPADKDAGHMAPSSIIGDPRDIDAKTVLCQKRKPLAALCDIASVSGQGQRELVLTLSTRSIVLRASSSHDRNLWLGAIMKAVLAAATAGADGTAHSLPATPRAPPAAKAPALPADVASAEIPALAKLSLAGLGDGIAAETPGNGVATDQRDTTSPKPHAAPMSASTYALPSVAADALGLAAVDGPNDKRLLGDFDFATQTENFDVDRIFDDDDVNDCVPDLQLQSKPTDSQPRDASRVNRTTEMPGTLGMDATEFGDIFGSFLDTLAAAPTLDPPGQFGLGGHSLSKLKPLAEHSGLAAAPRSLLAKYSESLSASRMMRSSASRAEKPRTMLGWQTNVSKANDLRGMDRATEIVQYKPKEPADTGISRIVAGPLATGAGGGDPSRKQNVRRVRQTRSESKVVPLKSIRLRLDGSIVRSRASAGKPHGASAQTPRYTVKGGRIEGIAGQHAPGAPSASRNPASAGGQLAPAGTGREGAGSALGEFGEIQRRLKLAEEQKQQEQRRQLLDKDGVDGVRIADIIKSRQDTPLAVQIEERRRMQQAKQLALMNQQMELRQMEAEARRQLAEQQQQHEQFRLRSLYPDARANRRNSVASAAYSMGHSEWQGCGSSIGESRMAEWPPAHGAHNGRVYSTNSAAIWQHHHLHQQQARHSAMYSGHQSRASQGQHENPQYEASMAASSLLLNPQGPRRSSSLGYSGSTRPVAGRPQWAQPVDGAVPPVPPLPRAPAGAHPHYGRTDSPAPSPPAYGNWVQHMPSGQGAQRMHPKWAAMAAHAPSLLQQLQQAQTTGVLPMHRPEKELYSKGAYQNAGIPPPVRGGTGVHHLGGGNTLLIDHVHDSQRTRRALIKKITTYTGGGAADTMPMPAYT